MLRREEWQKATGGRYLKLAEKNVPISRRKTRAWSSRLPQEQRRPITRASGRSITRPPSNASRAGDKDKALMINAFGDHFLTDAFAAGHLINKPDVMEQFKSQLKLDAKGESSPGL